MKANEAPEKLYLHPTAKGKVGASWLTFPLTNEDIEYVRKDAFIEKVCKFLDDRIKHDSIDYPMATKHLIEDFKKYMEDSL